MLIDAAFKNETQLTVEEDLQTIFGKIIGKRMAINDTVIYSKWNDGCVR